MKIIAVIPARYGSDRFPGKPLALILHRPMIQWVYESVSKSEKVSMVYVATDDKRIYDSVLSFGGNAIMTGCCSCGTERVYQASRDISCDVILNVQGDEPAICTEVIEELVDAFTDETVQMATLRKKMTNEAEISDPNLVKVVADLYGDALFFSRNKIPFDGRYDGKVDYYKHIGIYGYRKDFLNKFIHLDESPNERIEKLEQMRVLDHGFKIRTLETQYESIGVDVKEDIKKAEKILCARGGCYE